MNLSEVITDSELGEPYTVVRSKGKFAAGGWQQGEAQRLDMFGVVSLAGAREIKMLPEGDRINESRSFHSTEPLFTTDARRGGTSDIIEYQGTTYKVMYVYPYGNRGFYKAIAVRIKGD